MPIDVGNLIPFLHRLLEGKDIELEENEISDPSSEDDSENIGE